MLDFKMQRVYDYEPYFDPEFDSLSERIHPPSVCIDNDTRHDCTLVKIDSANKHGILLEMVQVLTDLDLVISKSYISSDGGWFMDVFHVTDQLGLKLTDQSLIHYIQQALGAERRRGKERQVETCLGRIVGADLVSSPAHITAIEFTVWDRPGLLSEIAAVLANLGCHVVSAVAWTHNYHAASIIYVEDELNGGGPILDPERLSHVEKQLESVVGAHHHHHHHPLLQFVNKSMGMGMGEECVVGGFVGRKAFATVRMVNSVALGGRTQMERRLHQMMMMMMSPLVDMDTEFTSTSSDEENRSRITRVDRTSSEVSAEIESCNEKGYSVVTVRSRDRPRLLFDTVCTLTDMKYAVFHATAGSEASLAIQEYYIRHLDGCTLDTEAEKRRLTNCLAAAVERRAFHGSKLNVYTRNRVGLLSDVTRILRENGMTVKSAEIATRGGRAIGYFLLTDLSGNDVVEDSKKKTVELLTREIGGSIILEVQNNPSSPSFDHRASSSSPSCGRRRSSTSFMWLQGPKFSIGDLVWSQLKRLFSNNLGSIRP